MWLALAMVGGKHKEPVGPPVGISHSWSSCAILVGQSLCWLLLLLMESFSKVYVPSHPGKKGEIVGERCGSEIQTAFKKANCLSVIKQGVESQVY